MITVILFDYVSEIVARTLSDLTMETKVLLILRNGNKIIRSYFTKEYGMNYITVKLALETLEDMGLTRYEALGDRRDTVYWSLTEKGEKAAEMLAALDEFIRNG